MMLNELLEDYQEYMEDEALDEFIDMLWSSTYGLRTYKKNYTFDLNHELLKFNDELIALFESYQVIEVKYAKSYYNDNPTSIDMIRIHINNMYMYLTYKDVYLSKEYYDELFKYRNLYYKTVERIKQNEIIDINELSNDINRITLNLESLKKDRLSKKIELGFDEYKELINGYIYRLFNNYKAPNAYANEFGWEIENEHSGWSEDNYIVKYFCKSLTGYMMNYIEEIKRKSKKCKKCDEDVSVKSKSKFCNSCRLKIKKEQTKFRVRKYRENQCNAE